MSIICKLYSKLGQYVQSKHPDYILFNQNMHTRQTDKYNSTTHGSRTQPRTDQDHPWIKNSTTRIQ
uniref:Uncharacterized protein n=1 Tax=Triticum urartu TaxID=4572 RepID=A0A8R7V6V7_TRIUA